MYTVKVFHLDDGRIEDERDFAFGTFVEIGYYLDHYGYNDGSYRIEITCIP
jgi:hypothetical protein